MEDDPYSLEVGEKVLGALSRLEGTLLAQDKGKNILV